MQWPPPEPRSRLRRAAAVAGLALTVLLGACATVPTSGPVEEHDFRDEPASSSVLVAPVPPAPGASPTLVVEGFLHAMSTDQADFAVARQYLTDAAASTWDPGAGTTVYADGTPPRETENSVVLSVPIVGTLSARGEFREATGRLSQDFKLVKGGDEQWRISQPPEGLLISRYDLANNYTAVDLHFLDITGTALVPDRRYFPLNSSLLKSIAKAQLAIPSWWLARAVRPVVTGRIAVESVEASQQGVAQVVLSSNALVLTNEQRHTLLAELTWTLTQPALAELMGVQVMAGVTPLTAPNISGGVLTTRTFSELAPVDSRYPSRLFALSHGKVLDVTDSTNWTQAAQVAPAVADAGSLAVRADLQQLAFVNAEGTRLSATTLSGTAVTTVLEGKKLLRPAYSRQQELWAIEDGAKASGFRVFGGTANAEIPFAAESMPEKDRVIAFRISPDGSRMALVVRGKDADQVGKDSDQVGIARIVRAGGRVSLQEFRPVSVITPPEAGMKLVDVGWATPTQLFVLVSHADADKSVSVFRVEQDSSTVDEVGPNGVAGLRELAAAPGEPPVVHNDDLVFRYESDFNWKVVPATAVTGVAYSG